MAAIAILIGNARYTREPQLPCCLEDLAAMEALVRAVGRYDIIEAVADADADRMRATVREILPPNEAYSEIFFYFSGHGAQVGTEFYHCGTSFEADRPNETGLSLTELHDFLRAAEPGLLIKIVDACFSGTQLVKKDWQPPIFRKEGFRNIVQLSSSLDCQTSLGGELLSVFTRRFCEACVRKLEGPVYYGDIINILRDDFIANEDQTPFFVAQGTGRELFTDDAARLSSFRDQFALRWSTDAYGDSPHQDGQGASSSTELVSTEAPSMHELLMRAETKMGDPQKAETFINALFNGVSSRLVESDFADIFELEVREHSQYEEPTARDLIIRVLSREDRPDRLVTAEAKRSQRRVLPWEALATTIFSANTSSTEEYTLRLNCSLSRAQIRTTLTPKFRTLQQLRLVLSCAPSLEHCYIFETTTQHPRTDWDAFSVEGHEIVRRWYKLEWSTSIEDIVEKVVAALKDASRSHLEEVTSRLAKK